MTQEEINIYEEKYKAALEKLQEALAPCKDGCKISGLTRGCLENIFPELNESEDERMWKLIKKYAHYNISDMALEADHITREQLETWLEKQGDTNETLSEWSEEDKQIILSIEQVMNCASLLNIVPEKIDNIKSWLKSLRPQKQWKPTEKQGKQKTDPCTGCINDTGCVTCVDGNTKETIKSKFKVGDWIVQENIGTYKVIEVCESWYEVIDNQNNHYSIGFDKEDMCHLWTIQDAKDGDVLVGKDGRPFIFTCEFDVQDDNPTAYCGINSDDRFIIGKGSHWTFKDGIKPATKEQHDLLFQKMEEAGYEWDSEKNVLKKIESKKLNADEVIGWLNHRELGSCDVITTVIPDDSPTSNPHRVKWLSDEFIEKFKKDFELC